MACLQGIPEICHLLHRQVLSARLTTNLKPLPPLTDTTARIMSSLLCTSMSKFLLFSFNSLMMCGRMTPSIFLEIVLLISHLAIRSCLILSISSFKFKHLNFFYPIIEALCQIVGDVINFAMGPDWLLAHILVWNCLI